VNDAEEKLTGGNMAEVTRVGNRVFRSTGFWSPTVHRLLLHLQEKNFADAPKFFGLEQEREVLEFIPGVVPQYPLPDFVLSNDSISRAAKMLRAFHDATRDFQHLSSDHWQVPELIREPVEVICHNDFSPYNTVFWDGRPVAMIDFDVAAPGPRVWDLAFAVYRFTHLCEISNGLTVSETTLRDEIELFCNQYGLDTDREVLETIPVRLTVLCSTIERLASEGHAGVIKNVEDGHLDFYRREIQAINKFLNR
jgi:Phosphotransferase enzyme family